MKTMKKLLAIIAVFIFVFAGVSAFASPQLVVDEPGLLSASELSSLTSLASQVSQQYDTDVAVVFVNSNNGRSMEAFTDDYFDYNGYGRGSGHSGIMLCLAISERQYHITTTGDAISVFTDARLDDICNDFLGSFNGGDWYGGAEKFINDCAYYLSVPVSQSGSSYGYDNYNYQLQIFSPTRLIIALLAGFGVAFLCLQGSRRQLKSVSSNNYAGNYLRDGTVNIISATDNYVTTNLVKTPIPRQNDSPGRGGFGGGSSIHMSSSGMSHGGRGGSF